MQAGAFFAQLRRRRGTRGRFERERGRRRGCLVLFYPALGVKVAFGELGGGMHEEVGGGGLGRVFC